MWEHSLLMTGKQINPNAPHHRKLQIFACTVLETFSGWVEAYPTRTEKASEITKVLLKELILKYRLPSFMQNDNGSSFIAKVTQQVSKALDIQWKQHASWRPQSTRKTEKMNHVLKKTVAKLCQETHLQWDKVLPIALL